MQKFWRSAKAIKVAAATLLLLALAVIATVHISSQKAIAIQGPGALRAITRDIAWMGVNEDLWVLDASGNKLAQKTAQELGLSEAVSNIAPAPDGEVLLTTRGQATWTVVRASDYKVVRNISPEWPDEFRGNVSRAIHVAVSPAWDIAVATGGGHTVLLFDKNGKLKARSRKDAYYFTNGLWHSPEGWWTTDTNNFVLRLMDSETLLEKQSITLTDATSGYTALGEMIASRGTPKAGTHEAPVATVSRLGFLMEPGYVVDVFPDGSQATYNREVVARLQDISWLGENLLVVDGSSYRVLRFSARREEMPPFGSPEVRRDLASMLEERIFWTQFSSRYMFLLGAALLLLGMAAYSRHKKLASLEVLAERSTSTVGTPILSGSQIFKQWLWVIFWPFFVRLIVALFCIYWLLGKALLYAVKHGLEGHWALPSVLILIVAMPVFFAALWQQRRYQRFSAKPDYEGTLNRKAMKWLLESDDWDQVKQSGEVPRETLSFRGPWPRWKQHWLVVTNRRVLQFAVSSRERRLAREWPRSAVLLAQSPASDKANNGKVIGPASLHRWLVPQINLRLQFDTGEAITGICPSVATAKRTAQLLTRIRLAPDVLAGHQKTHRRTPASRSRRWHQVLASALVPGLGQWLQNRFVTGTVYFTAAFLLLLLGVGPVLWAMSGPKMHVDAFTKASSLYWWLLLVAVSAWDAHHFSGTKTRSTSSRSKDGR